MQIDKYGNDVGYDKRLEDIKSRYGENSTTYKNAEILVFKLRYSKAGKEAFLNNIIDLIWL